MNAAPRSCLSVPGSSERMLAKAAGLAADEIVIDLEDAVAPAAKDDARSLTVRTLADSAWQSRRVTVRVNAPGSPWCHLDVAALASASRPPDSIVLPKVDGALDVGFVDRLLQGAQAAAGGTRTIGVQALIESAAGLGAVREIAAASARLDALILGYADLAASLGRPAAGAGDLDAWRPAQDAVLVAARANGLQAIDGPYLGIEPDEAFLAAAARARDQGFDGKWAIHPSQIDALNDVFTPTPDEIARAREVLAALDDAADGAVALDGQMLDEAVRLGAVRTLARAGELEAR